MGKGPNDLGSSRYPPHQRHRSDSLKRLNTDYIDLYQLHGFDARTAIEETLQTLDDFVRAGKIRYIGCSNFSGWHLMKSLALSEKHSLSRYIAHQAYYSLIGRDYERELLPLGLIGRRRRGHLEPPRLGPPHRKTPPRHNPSPRNSRVHSKASMDAGPHVPDEYLYKVVDAIDEVAKETGKTVPQIALNWLLQRPTVATLIIGARNEEQLRQNIGAAGWHLTKEQIAKLDAASDLPKPYPYWHQAQFPHLIPPLL